jgi:predicted nuclease of predicted toxin-antitoxin system
MAVRLYLDHHVPKAIALALRLRNVDVVTAQDDNANELDDPALLDRASELERVLFSQDDDLLREAARRQQENVPFGGVNNAHQLRTSIGGCVRDLELIAQAGEPEDFKNQILFLPL